MHNSENSKRRRLAKSGSKMRFAAETGGQKFILQETIPISRGAGYTMGEQRKRFVQFETGGGYASDN
jgi:hypothetical protein